MHYNRSAWFGFARLLLEFRASDRVTRSDVCALNCTLVLEGHALDVGSYIPRFLHPPSSVEDHWVCPVYREHLSEQWECLEYYVDRTVSLRVARLLM